MNQTPEPISFEEMWKDAGTYEAGIEDLARELYQEMIEAKVPLERIRVVVYLLREIKALDDYYTDTYAEIAMVNALEKKFRRLLDNHTHDADGIACLPLENVKEAKET